MRPLPTSLFCLAALALATGPATASVDPSPKPGGIYRLKPGIYVARGSSCEEPANAAIRRYDGRGISTPHSSLCRARVLSRKGQTYRVSQTCAGDGQGGGKPTTERQRVQVQDALTFSIATGGPSISYRYCPIYQLPVSLRKAAS